MRSDLSSAFGDEVRRLNAEATALLEGGSVGASTRSRAGRLRGEHFADPRVDAVDGAVANAGESVAWAAGRAVRVADNLVLFAWPNVRLIVTRHPELIVGAIYPTAEIEQIVARYRTQLLAAQGASMLDRWMERGCKPWEMPLPGERKVVVMTLLGWSTPCAMLSLLLKDVRTGLQIGAVVPLGLVLLFIVYLRLRGYREEERSNARNNRIHTVESIVDRTSVGSTYVGEHLVPKNLSPLLFIGLPYRACVAPMPLFKNGHVAFDLGTRTDAVAAGYR